MQDTIRTIQHELDTLLNEGRALLTGAIQGSHGDHPLTFIPKQATYQSWYAKALRVIRQLYPELADDFQAQYRALLSLQRTTSTPPWYRKALRVMFAWTRQRVHVATDDTWDGQYGKQVAADASRRHTCMGMTITSDGRMMTSVHLMLLTRLSEQLRMLNSVRAGLGYVLADLQSTLYGEVSDHIMATAYKLFHRGQRRTAVTLAGVVLELHLAKVATKYGVHIRHTSPNLTTLNAALKRGGMYDVEVWRLIQRLGATWHACVYDSAAEPPVDDLTGFLHGVRLVRTRVC